MTIHDSCVVSVPLIDPVCSIAPSDGSLKDGANEYAALFKTFNIPDQFVAGIDMGVTHSFGSHLAHERSESKTQAQDAYVASC